MEFIKLPYFNATCRKPCPCWVCGREHLVAHKVIHNSCGRPPPKAQALPGGPCNRGADGSRMDAGVQRMPCPAPWRARAASPLVLHTADCPGDTALAHAAPARATIQRMAPLHPWAGTASAQICSILLHALRVAGLAGCARRLPQACPQATGTCHGTVTPHSQCERVQSCP